MRTDSLMMHRDRIAVCSQIHTKHIKTPCGQNVELLNVKLAVHIVTSRLQNITSKPISTILHMLYTRA